MNNFKITEYDEIVCVSVKSGIRYNLCDMSLMMNSGKKCSIQHIAIIDSHILDAEFNEAAESSTAMMIDSVDVIGTTYCDDIESYKEDISDVIDEYELKQIGSGHLYAINGEGRCINIA